MGRKDQPVSPRVEKAAKLLLECPKLTQRQAMLAVEYSIDTLDNEPGFRERKRKQIYRCITKLKDQNPSSSPPKVVRGGFTDDSSAITEPTESTVEP